MLTSSCPRLVRSPFSRSTLLLLLILITGPSKIYAAELTLTFRTISDTILVGQPFMIGTDTVKVGSQLLRSGVDYEASAASGRFVLSEIRLRPADSLVITYTPLPTWLKRSFGRALPPISQRGAAIKPTAPASSESSVRRSSPLSISGAKSFRFSARRGGDADFGQSLDLKIAGELSPGLEIQGSLSDRGTDPAHGPLNSQLNELDRMNLKVHSRTFTAQLGDLSLENSFGLPRRKQLTGLAFSVNQKRWQVGGILSRPKGSYQTTKLNGSDGLQGPYRLSQNSGSRAIVPGSESLWLDGHQLQRGTDKDYQIDYATGSITFNVNHPIDARSRIEIDYEPRTSEYKKELFSSTAGMNLPDSLFYFSLGVTREGDDPNQSLIGEMTPDEKANLGLAGDSTNWISSVRPDTSGRYALVIDSLPDSVFHWVEPGRGAYSITFSYVGQGVGSYLLIGSGQYLYVGPNNGDHLPIKRLLAPERIDFYQAKFGVHSESLGEISADFRQTSFDRNLLSSIDDSDNRGHYYDLRGSRSFGGHKQTRLWLRRREREPTFKARQRINDPDFARHFLLPLSFQQRSTELLHEGSFEFSPLNRVKLKFERGELDYTDHFKANQTRLGAEIKMSQKSSLEVNWHRLASRLSAAGSAGDGEAQTWLTRAKISAGKGWAFSAATEIDSREQSYQAERQGTRYVRSDLNLNHFNERLAWEYYTEDSLISDWTEQLKRHRLTFGSHRSRGNLGYNLTLTRQWLDYQTTSSATFLGRLSFRLDDQRRKLNLSASYMVSDEVKNSRGITYLEVKPGEGDYIFDPEAPGGGIYIPDPDGDFIRIEEILSGVAHVRKGERSFLISKRFNNWQFRFDSRHVEELLDGGERRWFWILPFVADETQPYLFFNGRHSADLRLIPLAGFHAIQLSAHRTSEIRQVAGTDHQRLSMIWALTLRQKISDTYLEESFESFRHDRDSYYSGVGEVEGFKLTMGVRQMISSGEVSLESAYRRAEATDQRIETFSAKLSSRLKLFGQSQFRTEFEGYRHAGVEDFATLNYQLTDNRPGQIGLIWSASFKYSIKPDLRADFTLSGRHAQDRTARVTARGEVIATF